MDPRPFRPEEARDRVGGGTSRTRRRTNAYAAVPLYRKNNLRRINAKTDPYALSSTLYKVELRAWCWQVLVSANDDPPGASYKHWIITPDFLTEVA